MGSPELIFCSHRGPFAFERSAQGLVAKRGGGGLIGAVAPILERFGGTWIAAAMTDGDRQFAEEHPDGRDEGGFRLKVLDLPAEVHELHYGLVSNEHLWFLFHYLFDAPHQPVLDEAFTLGWNAYRRVNELFAEAIHSAGRADAVVVQDYHLMLVGGFLRARSRARRPLLYFHHTPWCEPDYFGLLPEPAAQEILRGLLTFDVVGFHAQRWADAFGACCERFLAGARVGSGRVSYKGRSTRVVVASVPLDVPRLTEELADPRTQAWIEHHNEMRAGRKLLLRVDRIDLSKNPLRGFLAFEKLLERKPKLARDVLFLALLYPSRQTLEPYRRYYAECTGVVRRINERFDSDSDDGPVMLHFEDDYYRSLGALRVYDTLLVNPVFDGLNLVAKEGAYANQRDGALILSRNAGVFEEIGAAAIAVNPFDVGATADAIERSLSMPKAERQKQAKRLKRLATGSTPEGWANAQLRAAGVRL